MFIQALLENYGRSYTKKDLKKAKEAKGILNNGLILRFQKN